MPSYLFVYGTLLKAIQHPLHQELIAKTQYVGRASFQGKLYALANKHYPAAILSSESNARVFGELYLVHCVDELFALLDDYEECSAAFPAPTEYIRQQVPVVLNDGQVLMAWVYIYNHVVDEGLRIVSGDYCPKI
jgi:gamma-glutamylcyclotransferase (GGCT)/AIG2-like uncharacterized protein YtfP